MTRDTGKLGEHTPRSSARRRGSLATRLALATVLLVLCVTGLTVLQLTQREWERLRESKRIAADMVANLFAGTMAPALDLGALEAVKAGLDGLRSNEMIVYAAVFSADSPSPLAEYHSSLNKTGSAAAEHAEGEIQVQSSVHSPTGARLGSVVVRVSLAQEVQAFRRTRARLVGFGGLFAAALASLLVGIMRRMLVAPLLGLEGAALRLAAGERVVVPAERDDELGSLSRAFNSMLCAMDDRERRIAAQHRRLEALFENMGQAIMVFGSDRLLTAERSRSAERWLDARPGNSIVDILYPEDDSLDIERQAFEAWLDVAFTAPADKFRELLELAPREIERHGGPEPMYFDLSFRLAEQIGTERQLMLLATDVSEQRRLQRSLLDKDRQHERELSALRRLAGGGAQLLGSFLEVSRRRLVVCRELLGHGRDRAAPSAADQRVTVEGVYQQLHTIHAEARCFDLAQVEMEIGLVENQLDGIRQQAYSMPETDASNLLHGLEQIARRLDEAERAFVAESPLGAAALDQIAVRRSRLSALSEAVKGRNDRLRRLVDELAARPLVESFSLLPEAVARWAERAGKRIELDLDAASCEIPLALSRVLGGALSHLLRNAVTHAIEPEAERVQLGKPPAGSIRVWAEPGPAGPVIRISDDGRGLDPAALGGAESSDGPTRALAAALGAGTSGGVQKRELSGAGVGLSAAQNELLSAGYHIRLVSTSAHGTRLELAPLVERSARLAERHVG